MQQRSVSVLGVVSIGLVLALAGCNNTGSGSAEEQVVEVGQALTETALTTSVTINNSWTGGYCATIRVRNPSATALAGWTVRVKPNATSVTNVWNAIQTFSSGVVTATPASNTAWLAAGGYIDFGFCASGATGRPQVLSAVGTPAGTILDGLSARVEIYNNWAQGYCANVIVTNGSSQFMPTWGAILDLGTATVTQVWNATYTVSGSRLTLAAVSTNTALNAGASTTAGFCASKNGGTSTPTVIAPVPAPSICGTSAGLTCAATEYCDYGTGACGVEDAAGVCRAKPATCSPTNEPVCGCDRVTYRNACEAAIAGARIDHTGVCTCGGSEHLICAATDYCDVGVGVCANPNAVGVCTPKAQACPSTSGPVCGCNGITYGDSCEAITAGINIDHAGECLTVCGTTMGIQCPAGQFCNLGTGACTTPDAAGTCATMPTTCSPTSDPVCGCNGLTYGNACQAAAAGISVDHTGACVAICGTSMGIQCPAGEYCNLGTGACATPDAAGVCAAMPTTCSPTSDPVCGCNGLTYGNACEAAAAGISVDHTGACVAICGTSMGIQCPAGEYCNLGTGACATPDAGGVCATMPTTCSPTSDPVCGCNGLTYGNACEAAAAGINISSVGACVAL